MIKIDGKLSLMEQTLVKMGNRIISMHECVCEVLAQPSKDRELEIIQADDRINHMEEEINDLKLDRFISNMMLEEKVVQMYFVR